MVESAFNQSFTDFEFLIFGDKSTDSSKEILRTHAPPIIRLVKSIENPGLTEVLAQECPLRTVDLLPRWMPTMDACQMGANISSHLEYPITTPTSSVRSGGKRLFPINRPNMMKYSCFIRLNYLAYAASAAPTERLGRFFVPIAA